MVNYPDRSEAIKLLHEYTKTDSLRRHALGVEQAMRKMANKYDGDPDEWGLTGLMHDFDYEMYPTTEDHPYRGNEILVEKGYPESITNAIMGHATYTGVPRDTEMAKSLFSVDELTGFIFAVTYVRPSKSILEVKPKSVKKKLKQKSFAASVIREDIFQSIEELGVDLTEHIQFVIDALSEKAEELGLKGTL
ncbi:MAG: HAD family hydrolase [Candidatus Marinimicrobia bacterium]|jgi:predicted hydrolase (HD superfamily)|nr:HAD family hydrolase [Candidatus Neomarinimicrobiota bacterium]MBT3796708.1 HAD family hydrolase [Candidatus Neomarinimicrobiota bacterium]MBT4149592.1 HAD family hydrolase [Candidatus Neomarinimicrobiota bacterium]MBT4318092.1 HAD family hydrolase [Candidatus Neomarinimicrobiota bacterium]MBT4784910.1 HAD family hydrolase [Candidatus Neomarinimicrobiota bacterium]|tara:strand:+ start:9114 stop:9689 length:576 start_codon:yes stop_codon:yes gene_type:complete